MINNKGLEVVTIALLLEPLKIKSLNLANRLVMPPLATAKAEDDGSVSKQLLDYYAEKSKGGYIALVIIEHSYVRPDGKAIKNQLSVADDSMIKGLKQLAEVIHGNGTKAVMQISHAGVRTNEEIIGTKPVGPSAVVNPREGNVPREISEAEISQIIKAFGDAARRVKEAGFDGVEIHSAHGYLLNQFLSPVTNQREDRYGGSLSNRMRIHLEIIEAVQTAVEKDFPVFLRLGADDFIEGGTTIEDSKMAAREFVHAGVDILDISGGLLGYNIPDLSGQGYFAHLSEAIKQVVEVPVILTGGITEAQAAEDLLAAGKADLIGVGRAILKDSDWARRAIGYFSET